MSKVVFVKTKHIKFPTLFYMGAIKRILQTYLTEEKLDDFDKKTNKKLLPHAQKRLNIR